MHQSLKLSQKALLMVAALLIAELCLLVGLTSLLGQAQYHRMRAEHSKKLFDEADAIYKLFYESGISLIRLGMSQSAANLKVFDDALAEIPRRVQRMRDLSAGNAEQLKAISTIDNTLQTKGYPFLKDIRNSIIDNKGSAASLFVLKKKKKVLQVLLEELGAELTVISAPEREVQEQSPKVIQTATDRATVIIYCLFAFNIVVAFGIFYVFMGGIVKRLAVISDNSERMARGESISQPMSGNDEIAQLDHSFHTMADALREALRKERTILENAADIIITIDSHNQISSVNPACVQTLGYQPEELLGMRIGSLLDEDTAATTIDALKGLKGSEKTLIFDNQLRRKNGTMCDMRWSANWSESEKSFFCVVHDVSQQKELERLKKEVIRMVSHDLRSPLSSVASLLELLSYEMYGKLNEVGERRINATRLEIDRLIRMINDLLDFEKMEAGKLELQCSNTNSEAIFEKSIEAIRGLA
jgi:PAS domain S-box-containing protein